MFSEMAQILLPTICWETQNEYKSIKVIFQHGCDAELPLQALVMYLFDADFQS